MHLWSGRCAEGLASPQPVVAGRLTRRARYNQDIMFIIASSTPGAYTEVIAI